MPVSSTVDRVDLLLARSSQRSDIPAVGRIVQELQTAVRSETVAALDVVRLILKDPGLSSKVLRVVNSAFYRPRCDPISTITRAVLVLGFETIRDVATGLVLVEALLRSGGPCSYLRQGLQRALLRGLLARELAARVGYPDAEEAYLLGLFAEWGILWTAAWLPQEFERAVARQQARGERLEDALREVLGVPPAEIAAIVLQRWNFPSTYAEYFRLPAPTRLVSGSASERLLAVVHVAAEATAPCADDPEAPTRRALEQFAVLFHLGPEPFAAASQAARTAFQEQAPLFGLGPAGDPVADSAPHRHPATHPPHDDAAEAHLPGADPQAALAIVGELTRAIVERLDINDILTMAIEGIARAGGFDVVCLFLVTPGRDQLVARLGFGEGVQQAIADLRIPLAPSSGMLAEAVLQAQPRTVADGTTVAQLRMVRSVAIYPLVVRGRSIGALLAGRTRSAATSPADLDLVGLFASQAALALDRSVR